MNQSVNLDNSVSKLIYKNYKNMRLSKHNNNLLLSFNKTQPINSKRTSQLNNKKQDFSNFISNLEEKSKNNKLISQSFTKNYKITNQIEQMDVLKLNSWEKENLLNVLKISKILYTTLSQYYKEHNEINKQNEINEYKKILSSRNYDIAKLLNSNTGKPNKIFQNFIKRNQQEQGSILFNTISKTKTRFNINALNKRDIRANLGVDTTQLEENNKDIDFNTNYYNKVIKEKIKEEERMRSELFNISLKLYNKKNEHSKLLNELNEIYKNIDDLHLKFNNDKNNIKKAILKNQEVFEKQKIEKSISKVDLMKEISKHTLENNKLEEKLQRKYKIYQLNLKIKEHDKKILSNKIIICKKEEDYIKLVNMIILKEQKDYYLEILKRGYDSRNEGLSWCVKNLLEMQVNLEYHHFPKFLSHEHCDYLIKIANILLEESQLKIILKTIKKKHEKIQNDETQEKFNKIADYSTGIVHTKKNIIDLEVEKLKEQKRKENTIAERINTMFNKIYKKYEEAFKVTMEKKNEELKIERITANLRETLIENGGKDNKNFQELNKVLLFLENNQSSKEYLEIILILRGRLEYLKKQKNELRNEQIRLLKEQVDLHSRLTFAQSSLQYDLVFTALFGQNLAL